MQKYLLSIIFSAAILLVLTGSAHATKKFPNAELPSNIDGVDAIESAYYSLADLTAKFIQTTKVTLVDRTVTKKGTFSFKKGGKLSIVYDGTGGKHYVSDGSTLWIFVPGDDASLQTFAVNDESVPKEALSFLNGFGKLKKEFTVSISDAFQDSGTNNLSLHLIPRSDAKHYDSLDALFGPDHLLIELIVSNISGNTSHYKFSDIKTNTNLPDKMFTLSSGRATPNTIPK